MTKCDFCASSTIVNGVAQPKDEILSCERRKCEKAIEIMANTLRDSTLVIGKGEDYDRKRAY